MLRPNATFNLQLGLQKHFHHLEAVALEREFVEDVEDFTQPDVVKIECRAGSLLEEFNYLLSSRRADCTAGQKRKVRFSVLKLRCQGCNKTKLLGLYI